MVVVKKLHDDDDDDILYSAQLSAEESWVEVALLVFFCGEIHCT